MASVLIEYDIAVEMRDGVTLRADVYRPVGSGPWPVIVARTPYGKTEHYELQFLEPAAAARRGFIAVVQDVRGRHASEGDFTPLVHEAADGEDTVAWAAQLDGCNGRVGMWGPSYLGNVQWQAASRKPEALRAIAPERTWCSPSDGFVSRGGVREVGLVRSWGLGVGLDVLARRLDSDPEAAERAIAEVVKALDQIPGSTYAEISTPQDPVLNRYDLPDLASPDVQDAADVSALVPRIEVPSLHVAGWFDVFSQGTLDNYVAASRHAPARLVVGPWNHVGQESLQGEVNFGLAGHGGAINLETSILDITFDCLYSWLTDEPASGPAVMIYTLGANEWREEDSWPIERAVERRLFLTQAGCLRDEADEQPSASRSFVYDPNDPVPTVGGSGLMPYPPAGAMDQVSVETRDDVVVFTSEELVEDLEVTGRVTALLTVSTDAPTTDWVVRLCDVHPDGRSFNVTDGICRSASDPHRPTVVEVDLWSTSMLFRRGHRLRVQVTSSCFPRWDRNPNVLDPDSQASWVRATQTIHTSLAAPSLITLPVVATT